MVFPQGRGEEEAVEVYREHGLHRFYSPIQWKEAWRVWRRLDFYSVLGLLVDPAQGGGSVSEVDVRRAFLAKAKIYHPDKGGDGRVFQELLIARDVLKDGAKREIYDKILVDRQKVAETLIENLGRTGKKVVKLRRKLHSEATVQRFLRELEKLTAKSNHKVVFEDFDIAQNPLPTESFERLFVILSQNKPHVERFRAFGCPTFDDQVCSWMTEWLRNAEECYVPCELHLSDNAIADQGFQDMMKAIEMNDAFPGPDPRNPRRKAAVMLRLECNYINENIIRVKELDGTLKTFRKSDPRGARGPSVKVRLLVREDGSFGQRTGPPPAFSDERAQATMTKAVVDFGSREWMRKRNQGRAPSVTLAHRLRRPRSRSRRSRSLRRRRWRARSRSSSHPRQPDWRRDRSRCHHSGSRWRREDRPRSLSHGDPRPPPGVGVRRRGSTAAEALTTAARGEPLTPRSAEARPSGGEVGCGQHSVVSRWAALGLSEVCWLTLPVGEKLLAVVGPSFKGAESQGALHYAKQLLSGKGVQLIRQKCQAECAVHRAFQEARGAERAKHMYGVIAECHGLRAAGLGSNKRCCERAAYLALAAVSAVSGVPDALARFAAEGLMRAQIIREIDGLIGPPDSRLLL